MKRSPSGGARPASVRPAATTSVLHPPSEDDDGDGPYIDLELSEVSASGSDDDYVIRAHGGGGGGGDLYYSCRASLLFTPSSKPNLPSAILRSATRLRVFILRFKKPKSPPNDEKRTAKFLFSSSRSSARSAKLYAEESFQSPASSTSSSDGKRNVIGKYLNKIKPLYGRRVSKRRSGELTAGDLERSGNHSLGLRMVARRSRKSRSESAAVRSPPLRCDDSLTQQEDGIESAIAHCKRSFSADNR